MKPGISMITGRHLTATDKRNILACIEYLREQDHHDQWLNRKRSPKQYHITPDSEKPNIYNVRVLEKYTTDWGEKRQRKSNFTVEAKGIEPLLPILPEVVSPAIPQEVESGNESQADLFEDMIEP